MKDIEERLQYKGYDYRVIFNLNVMERIQEKYGSFGKWAAMTDGGGGEPDAKAVIFGWLEMINEGIDMDNEENGTQIPFMTAKQIGRMLSEIGLNEATMMLNRTVIDSTESAEKNA